MKRIHCHNLYHLGDCIQAVHFLIHASRLNEIVFDFFCNPQYHNQLKEFIGNDRINLLTSPNPAELSFDTWIGAYKYDKICEKSIELYKNESDQATYFLLLWNTISDLMKIKCPFKEKKDMIYDEDTINQECSHKEKYDVLFINSKNMSIPFPDFENEVLMTVEKLKNSGKTFILTDKKANHPSTTDYGLSVVEIARLSKTVKKIIAVNTGPLHLCMNKWTIENVDEFVVWSPEETFNHGPKFKCVKSLRNIS
jgi:hypothetical protein